MYEIPLCYPKIPTLTKLRANGAGLYGLSVAFEKYDGTNLHWVIEGGRCVAFGARRTRFPYTEKGIAAFKDHHPGLEHAPGLLAGKSLPESGVLFTEYLGDGSFDGAHDPSVGPDGFKLVLIDVGGLLNDPEGFLAYARGLDWPDVAREVWRGRLLSGGFSNFLHDLRTGRTGVVEGVVVKNAAGTFKVKTEAWEAQRAQRG